MLSKSSPAWFIAAICLGLLAPAPVDAQQQCSSQNSPSATLLFPYFELPASEDSTAPESLISISNLDTEPTLVKVVVWTNCHNPVFSFELYLEAQATQPLNLRQVILEGMIPATGQDRPVELAALECSSLLNPSPPTAQDLAALRRLLAGEPDPVSDICYARRPREGGAIYGYLTADVVTRCSPPEITPFDASYFDDGEGGSIIGNDNVLAGDLFFVDQEGNAAQGFEAVSVIASEEPTDSQFYRLGGNRLVLPARYRGRFLNGGGFDGGTDLIVWTSPAEGSGSIHRAPCSPDSCDPGVGTILDLSLSTESGDSLPPTRVFLDAPARLSLSSEILPEGVQFGSFVSEFSFFCGGCSPPVLGPQSTIVWPIYTAEGRFSASLKPVGVDPECMP